MELAAGARVCMCVCAASLCCLLACLLRFVLSPSQAQDGRGLRLLLNHMLKYMSDNRTTLSVRASHGVGNESDDLII